MGKPKIGNERCPFMENTTIISQASKECNVSVTQILNFDKCDKNEAKLKNNSCISFLSNIKHLALKIRSHYIAQADPECLGSSNPLASTS